MGRPKSNNVQINISIPMEWKKELENLARIYSVEEGETITFLDLMRRGIQEKYHDKFNPVFYSTHTTFVPSKTCFKISETSNPCAFACILSLIRWASTS